MEADFVDFAVENLTRTPKNDESNELYEEVNIDIYLKSILCLYNINHIPEFTLGERASK